jgi:hypothetical protein
VSQQVPTSHIGDPDEPWRLQRAHRQRRYREWPCGSRTIFHVISQLDHRYAAEVEDIITSPPELDLYTKLRNELVQRLSPSREQGIRQLLTIEEMGDRKPSHFLRHLRGLAPDVPEDILRTIWSSRLHPYIRTTLAGQQECSLDTAARCADPISEVAPQPALASVGPPPPATPHFCRRSTSPARWRHSSPSRTVSAPASGLPFSSRNPGSSTRRPTPAPSFADQTADPPPEETPHPPSAGTSAASGPERKSVPLPAPTASRENQRSRHYRRHMSALQQQAASSLWINPVNGSSWSTRFRPLRVPPQARSATQRTGQLRPLCC